MKYNCLRCNQGKEIPDGQYYCRECRAEIEKKCQERKKKSQQEKKYPCESCGRLLASPWDNCRD